MKSLLATSLVAAAAVRAAHDAPTRIKPRATSICGQWDSVETGVYTVYQDLWNEGSGTGSQCTTVDSMEGGVLAWSTSWSWAGNSTQVKSYANTVTNFTVTTLSEISSIPSVWSWTYTGSDMVADVSYDLFTSSSAAGSNEYEVMVWLDALGGAGPISSTGSAVASPEIAGTTWALYDGYNGATRVFSFVASSAVADFSGDLMDFLGYLVDNEGMPDSQYLLSIGAGTEPFTGTGAVFSVASYSCGVSAGGAVAAATSAAAAGSPSAAASSVEASATSSVVVVASSSVVAPSSSSPSSSEAGLPPSAYSPAVQQTSSRPQPSEGSGSGSGSFSEGMGPSQQASTTVAPAVTAAPTSAEAATTLATSTRKSCRKRRAE